MASAQTMRWIYISPHFDDAVLSCGGLIWEQTQKGLPVEIWTIFAGNPPPGPLSAFARETHTMWGTGDGEQTVGLRKAEDRQAASLVGAQIVHFDFPDCIYRRAPDGIPLYQESVFGPLHPCDLGLPERIAAALTGRLESSGPVSDLGIVCPLALGGHVDHLLARQAVQSLQRVPVWYYADVPYLINYPQSLDPAIAAMQAELFDISEEGVNAWLRGVAAYRSQVDSLIKTGQEIGGAIRSYWEGQRGLRLWRPIVQR